MLRELPVHATELEKKLFAALCEVVGILNPAIGNKYIEEEAISVANFAIKNALKGFK